MKLEIRNYTVYNTDDIRAIYERVKRSAPRSQFYRGGENWTEPEVLVVVYWQGRRQEPNRSVRNDCQEDKERGGHALRIKRPDKLSGSPVELLVMAGENPQVPSEVEQEVANALYHLYAWGRAGPGVAGRIRVMAQPELCESGEERKARVEAKRVRKAVRGALHSGLRMGLSLPQIDRKIEGLEVVEKYLGPKQRALLTALRDQKAAMQRVADAAKNLCPKERG